MGKRILLSTNEDISVSSLVLNSIDNNTFCKYVDADQALSLNRDNINKVLLSISMEEELPDYVLEDLIIINIPEEYRYYNIIYIHNSTNEKIVIEKSIGYIYVHENGLSLCEHTLEGPNNIKEYVIPDNENADCVRIIDLEMISK